MTAQGRTTASRLSIGDRILVELYNGSPVSTTRKLTGKNGVVVATVEGLNSAAPVSQYGRGRRVTYRRIHTDQGSFDAAPSQTFALAPVHLTEDAAVQAEAPQLHEGVEPDYCHGHRHHSDAEAIACGRAARLRGEPKATPVSEGSVQHDESQAPPRSTDDVDSPAQRLSFGPSLPSTFADAVQALAPTIAGGGVIGVRTYTEGGTVSELVDYQLRAVTSDPALTRDGEPHLAVVRCNKDGEAISRSVELIPLDEVHTLHVY